MPPLGSTQPPMARKRVELHPELWLQIIELLHNPLPRPNGRQKRSAVSQNDLASCMRVCKMFHNITAPLLYKEVVVDYLPSFIYGVNQRPAAAGIRSKRALIGQMERLFLEYFPKTEATYAQLLYGGCHPYYRVGLNTAGMIDLCMQECDWVADAAGLVRGIETKLLTMATGVFLGGQTDIWEPFHIAEPPGTGYSGRQQNTVAALSSLLHPHLIYFCQRALYGPLTYPSLPIARVGATPRTSSGPIKWSHRAHHGTSYFCATPVLFGGDTRWYCPFDTGADLDINHTLEMIGRGIAAHILNRELAISAANSAVQQRSLSKFAPATTAVNVDIYVPAILMTAKWKKRLLVEVAHAKKESERMKVPHERYENDVWRVRSIKEAPSCEACGWCIDDL